MDGISFFPHYVVPDDSIRLVHAKFGIAGYGIIFKLFERIFSRGYYSDWNEDICALFAADCLLSSDKVEAVVQYSVDKGVFDSSMFGRFGILTSVRIQRDYFFASKCKNELSVNEDYLLIPLDEVFPKNESCNDECSSNTPVISEKKDLFNEYLIAKNNECCEEFVRENVLFRPWLEQFDYMVIIYAFSICIRKDRRNIDYLFGILGNWKKSGYTSLSDIDDPTLSIPDFLSDAPDYLVDIHRNF